MRATMFRLAVVSCLLVSPAFAGENHDAPASEPEKKKEAEKEKKPVVKCDAHGVDKALCTRCNPKLESIFKKKGDWCSDHTRAESQCVLCKPELAKEGVK